MVNANVYDIVTTFEFPVKSISIQASMNNIPSALENFQDMTSEGLDMFLFEF